jgi:hypothetical protein
MPLLSASHACRQSAHTCQDRSEVPSQRRNRNAAASSPYRPAWRQQGGHDLLECSNKGVTTSLNVPAESFAGGRSLVPSQSTNRKAAASSPYRPACQRESHDLLKCSNKGVTTSLHGTHDLQAARMCRRRAGTGRLPHPRRIALHGKNGVTSKKR